MKSLNVLDYGAVPSERPTIGQRKPSRISRSGGSQTKHGCDPETGEETALANDREKVD